MKTQDKLTSERQPYWMETVYTSLAGGKKARALAHLDRIIAETLPLFDREGEIPEDRRLAWLCRIDLLREWGRLSEALAWTCFECELSPDNVVAQALKEQLKSQLRLSGRRKALGDSSTRKALHEGMWRGVAGMREVKAMLERDVILPLQEPELYRRYKVDLPNGVLLYGPPGCGKTFIARKLAELLGFSFMEVKPSDLASIYVHGGQEKIGKLFEDARQKAPTLLFFDELDALVPNRGGAELYHHYAAEVNEFLVQLNECWESKVLVIAATNLLEKIDPAVRRPGRLDKKVFIGPPDLEARVELLKLYMEGRPQAAIDWLGVAQRFERHTAAEVEQVTDEAARAALSERRDITQNDLLEALRSNPPSLSPEAVERYRRG